MPMPVERLLPIGAQPVSSHEVHFRVWAPGRQRVEVVFEGDPSSRTVALEREPSGYHSGWAAAVVGALYRFRLDGGSSLFPDPVSRFQPDGPHGPSQIVDSK